MGTIQLCNDAFVITFRIGGYKVKRGTIDRGVESKSCTLIYTRG